MGRFEKMTDAANEYADKLYEETFLYSEIDKDLEKLIKTLMVDCYAQGCKDTFEMEENEKDTI